MPKALWNGVVLAESDACQVVEGNTYFPPESLHRQWLTPSATTSHCPWKGDAHYYSVAVNGATNPDAAWYYPQTKPEAKNIEGYVAFWRGVEIQS